MFATKQSPLLFTGWLRA